MNAQEVYTKDNMDKFKEDLFIKWEKYVIECLQKEFMSNYNKMSCAYLSNITTGATPNELKYLKTRFEERGFEVEPILEDIDRLVMIKISVPIK